MKTAVICNSTNPDLVEYFRNYITSFEDDDLKVVGSSKLKEKISLDYFSSASDKSMPTVNSLYAFSIAPYLLFVFFKSKIELIHFTTAHFDNLPLAVLLKLFSTKRLLFTIHDYNPHPGKKSFAVSLYNWIVENWLADDLIFFCKKYESPKVNNYYQRLAGFEQVILEPKTGDYFLFFGRIDQYKGINHILELAMRIPEKQFVVAGKGNDDALSELTKLSNVTLINRFIKDKEVKKLFREASLTLLPYTSATQSGVIILSYAHATPVMTFSVGCLDNYVDENTGWIFKPYDIIRMEGKLRSLSREEIKRKSRNTITAYNAKFSRDSFKKEYQNILKNIEVSL